MVVAAFHCSFYSGGGLGGRKGRERERRERMNVNRLRDGGEEREREREAVSLIYIEEGGD